MSIVYPALRGELVRTGSAFLSGLVPVALEHEIGGAPDVDFGYHRGAGCMVNNDHTARRLGRPMPVAPDAVAR